MSTETDTAVNLRVRPSLAKQLRRRFSMHPLKSSLILYDDGNLIMGKEIDETVVDTTDDRLSSMSRVTRRRKLGVSSLQRRASACDLLSVKGFCNK
jgi:hypothetical protein